MHARPTAQGSYHLVNHEWRPCSVADVTHLSDGKTIRLNRDIAYRGADDSWTVAPKGFQCDGASIPRIVWTLAGHPFGVFLLDAIIHDWLYVQLRHLPKSERGAARLTADDLFLDGMLWRARTVLDNRMRYRVKARTYYRAVRLFGGLTI